MKKIPAAFALLFLAPFAATAAEDDYHGVVGLRAQADILRPVALTASFDAPAVPGEGGLLAGTSRPFRIKIDYDYSPALSVQAELDHSSRFSGNNISLVPTGTSMASGLGVAAVGKLALGFGISLRGSAGVRRVAYEQDAILGPAFGAGASTQGRIGLGVQYDYSKSLGFQAQLNRSRNFGVDRSIGENDGEGISLGVSLRF